MHQALSVSDIVVEIFSHIQIGSSVGSSRKSLAALARTRKSFYNPAMDLLWAVLPTADPLLGCVTRLHPQIYGGGPESITIGDWKSIATHCVVLKSLSMVSPLNNMTRYDLPRLSNTLVTPTINEAGADDLLGQGDLNFAPFLNLTALSLRFETLPSVTAANITTVIQDSKFPLLKEFEFRVVEDFSWRQAEPLFRALSQSRASQTLERVEIIFCDSDEGFDNPLPLHSLRIHVESSIYLDNDLLLEAMSSWPHIEYLSLDDVYQPTVTLHGLFAALRLCPHLHTLHVYMDAARIDIDPEADSFQHPSLHTLDLGASLMVDAATVARIIFSMLPHVNKVMYNKSVGGSSAWGRVNRHLQSFAAVDQTRIRDS
ncbi:hypothetical protein K503DRAFT_784748 [Rhizopogon vinicolor AM-OR11-026]|uniref:F-box domain-containing protein n=1 Tax=Rhizopogon vinicolor AM-OR11-026 TaxID=1314800 RepID=A0A1B7MTJ3_9AGAM|nr:hypothetical protein K503DRAFT_784748 [Rhizopogon vinicolor AM-OR11-026]